MCPTFLLRHQSWPGPIASGRRLFASELGVWEHKLEAKNELEAAKNELQTAEDKWSNATESDTKSYYREAMTSAQKLVSHYTDKVISIDGGDVSGENGQLAMRATNRKAAVVQAQKLIHIYFS